MISVVIPHAPLDAECDASLRAAVQSLPPDTDETLVIVNQGTGMGPAVNLGWRLARGDYLAFVANDVVFQAGCLADLCIPGTVAIAHVNGRADMLCAVFCWPRDVYERVGGFDEQMAVGQWEDQDLVNRMKAHGVPLVWVPAVQVTHRGGMTTMKLGRTRHAEDDAYFKSKWGWVP